MLSVIVPAELVTDPLPVRAPKVWLLPPTLRTAPLVTNTLPLAPKRLLPPLSLTTPPLMATSPAKLLLVPEITRLPEVTVTPVTLAPRLPDTVVRLLVVPAA